MLGAHPLKAVATGGRNILTHAGNIWDNYQVDFTYPGNVHFAFASTQFGDLGFDVRALYGADGLAEMPYSGPVPITGKRLGLVDPEGTTAIHRAGKFRRQRRLHRTT